MKIRVGTSGFAYKEWKGTFYPKDVSAEGMLAYYASRFGTVEINNSFYRMPSPKVVAGWASQVPEGFSFVLKAPQKITHFARLKEVADPVGFFLKVAAELGDKQGPLLFQLPPNFKKDTARLAEFLALVPPSVRVAMEFRHASWWSDEVYDALRARGVALAAVETEEGRTPLVPTASFGYVRLREVEYSDAELAAWAKDLRAQPWGDAWVFFKHEDSGAGPAMASRLVQQLERVP